MNRAEILIEALPYIKKFNGKTFVIKYGGSVMENQDLKKKFIEDVALLKLVGINIVIVHGGGKRINAMLDKVDMDVKFINGQRVTDEDVMKIVEMVLSGSVNKDLSACLSAHGIHAVGLSGRDSRLLIAEKKLTKGKDGETIDLGYVGNIVKVNKNILNDLIAADYVPIISPVASGEKGETFNVNADTAAGAIAGALGAEKLILLSDIKGLYKDINDESSFISSIDIKTTREYIEKGIIAGGMIPKMQCCMDALNDGAGQVAIIDGRVEHSLLIELFTHAGSGTMVTR
ncbi:MAG: acetylglutamate kinase [Anaerovoracaceae bacterium]|nr:acetylglutamate kinase [Bacillota bacterium]MDY2671089.1 acetylglutamate kinase [Anaerovoracaceae bacterium]